MNALRWLSVLVVVALVLAGPLAPSASAQQSQAPKLYEEAVKAPEEPAKKPSAAHSAGAAAVNVIHVPGKLVLCTLGGLAGLVALALTFGSGYRAAATAVEEGCGGSWVVTAKDLQERDDMGGSY